MAAPSGPINGQLYDPARIDVKPRLNATETWTFTNNSGQPHPMHIHDIQWRILDINGVPPVPGEDGWKDTFLVPGPGSVTVVGTFVDNLGATFRTATISNTKITR
jgi:FtsP/CotA-like multicopper oxidase with cupredoxin domain